MESSVRDKMEEQGTSNIDVAGSDNSTLVVDTRGKRKKDPLVGSSLKRVCAPSEDSIESDSDSDRDTKTYTNASDALRADDLRQLRNRVKPWPERKPTYEQWDLYNKQLADSESFDVEYSFRIKFSHHGSLIPCCPLSDTERHKFQKYLPLAAEYLYAGSQVQLDDFQVVQVVRQVLGLTSYYYITFIAKGSLDNVVRCYQTKACRQFIHEPNRHTIEDSVKFARLRDERGHLTAEDIVSKQSCDKDSLVQLYTDEFCPIQPVSAERKEMVDLSMFKYYVQIAADKASEDLEGGKKLQCLKMEEAYEQVFCFTANYYITFEGSLDGERRSYGAKVILTFDEKCPRGKVESVWQKDDPRYLTVEQRINKRKVKEAQKCFDADCQIPAHMKNIPGVITSVVDTETLKGKDYKKFKGKIVKAVRKGYGGKKKLRDLEIEKANEQDLGSIKHHYITFSAKEDGECSRCLYRAKVTRWCPCEYEIESECGDDEGENECDDEGEISESDDDLDESESDDEDKMTIVEFVSQKDDDGGYT